MLTRRDLIRMGIIGAGYGLTASDRRWSPVTPVFADVKAPTSPKTIPFVQPLPLIPRGTPVDSFYGPGNEPPDEHKPFLGVRTNYFHLVVDERWHQFDPMIPLTPIWGFRDGNPNVPDWPFALGPSI